ncbi:MAG: glycosyltransferase family 39 protein [Muribaculaceae bacterium]|nr:glycosyltransferase family 39 protein [Muribaculaceae bacterium]
MSSIRLNRWNNSGGLPGLLCFVFLALLPIIIFRDFTPSNELRYLSIADESLASGRWWAFTNHGVPYADKPPLYLWCIMVGKYLFGTHFMWFYSLFSIIPAFVIAIIMDRWASLYLSPEFRKAAVLMLFSCGLYAGMLFTLRMDMMMTMFIVLALYQFSKLIASEEKPSVSSRLLFALWIFLAVFSKGPMGILIPLVATAVWLLLKRKFSLFSRAWGWQTWSLFVILCAGWFGAVYAEGGTEYLDNLLVHQTVGRAVNSFHHKRPLWYYLVSLTYTLQPWTFIIFGAIVFSVMKFKKDLVIFGQFFLVIILSSFVLLSLISSKLQVYMLPVYPFMVYLAILVCSKHKDSGLVALGIAVPTAILAVAGVGSAAVWLNLPYDLWKFWLPAAAVVLIVGTTMTFRWLYVRRQLSLAISSLSATVLLLVFVAGFAIEDFNADLGYGKLAEEAVIQAQSTPDAKIITWKIDRPENIDVYLKGIPFQIEDVSDSVSSVSLRSFPAVVMTRAKYSCELPFVKKKTKVGRNFVVLVCDTANTVPDNLSNVSSSR